MATALRARDAAMQAGPAPDDTAIPGLPERLHAFRSLGGNCEFGFVQRYGGVEPSGLFRFSYTPLDDLIHALSTDFAAYGAPGDLRVEETESGTYYCRSRRYNIWSNTAQAAGSIDPEALLEREYGRIAHLKGRMLEDLAAGSRILVRKISQGETEADLDRLTAAIRRHGPSTLLRVTEAGPGWRREPVRQVGDRIYEGRVRRFAPTERAWDLDLKPWFALCDSAYAARYDLPEARLDAGPFAEAIPLPTRLHRHRGRHREHAFSAFTRAVAPAAFDPAKVYVFSTWVWIPEGSHPSRVFAVAGRDRLGSCDADPTVRDRWQRIWAAGRLGRGKGKAPVGLAMLGTRADRLWSSGAQLHEGPVPRPAEPPTANPTAGFFRRLAGWCR